MSVASFHPAIQTSIFSYANPQLSLSEIGDKKGISKQAVAKRIELGRNFFMSYGVTKKVPEMAELERSRKEVIRLQHLVSTLRLQLVIHGALVFLLTAFKESVQKFFPSFKLSRLSVFQKKRVLDHWWKYKCLGGTMKAFCQAIGRSPATLRKWLDAYRMHDMAGLHNTYPLET